MGAGSQHCTEEDRLRTSEYICAADLPVIRELRLSRDLRPIHLRVMSAKELID